MRRTVALTFMMSACLLAPAGCGRSTSGVAGGVDTGVDAVARQLRDFTEELAGKVESAPDPKAGVGEAQRLLDSRKAEMSERVGALKRQTLAKDAAARGRWLEAEVDGTRRVRDLKLKYLDASLRDPELKAGLERLVADYDSIFKDR